MAATIHSLPVPTPLLKPNSNKRATFQVPRTGNAPPFITVTVRRWIAHQ